MCKEEESISTLNGKVTEHVHTKVDCHRPSCHMSDDYLGPNKQPSGKKLGYVAELAAKQYNEMEKKRAESHQEWEKQWNESHRAFEKQWAASHKKDSEAIDRLEREAAGTHKEHLKAQHDAHWAALQASQDAFTKQLEAQMMETQEAFQAEMDAHVKAAETAQSTHQCQLEGKISASNSYHMRSSHSSRHSSSRKIKEGKAK